VERIGAIPLGILLQGDFDCIYEKTFTRTPGNDYFLE
jgi:hypothetical protein